MAVAAIVALSSCSSDDIVSDENGNENGNASNAKNVFTASIGEITRTVLTDGTKVKWSNGDKISLNGMTFSTSSTEATATFTAPGDAPEKIDGKYYAVYPTTVGFDASTKEITYPETQTYDAATNGISNIPMMAISTTNELKFKNICSVLAVKIPSGTVKKIKVWSHEFLGGTFTIDTETFAPEAKVGYHEVILDCGSGVTANNTTFYIAIPAQKYSDLIIYISSDGTTYKEAMATKVVAGLGTFARNKIYNINYEKNAVQLWNDGPYFATMNLGETTLTGKTKKYKWGVTEDGGSENTGSYDVNHDTAMKIWGNAWRMPTQEEYESLVSNCNYTYDSTRQGFTVSSKTSGYGSVFFPGTTSVVSGYTNCSAVYWAAKRKDTSNAYIFSMSHNGETGNNDISHNGGAAASTPSFVRAVINIGKVGGTTIDGLDIDDGEI